jgi:hypothetical protein
MLSSFLISRGLTRDSALWFWTELVSVAGLIASGLVDIVYWANYLAIPLTTVELHWIQALAVLILWFAGKHDTSPLPGAKKV